MLYFPVPVVALFISLGLAATAGLVALLMHFASRGKERAQRRVLAVAIALWAAGLAVAVLPGAPLPDPSIPAGTFNWAPFLAHQDRDLGVEMAANLGLFAPLGLMLAFLWRRLSVLKTTMLVLGISICIETTQLLLRNNRAADITDIITNTVGGLAAALLGWALAAWARGKHPAEPSLSPGTLLER
ncbi:MAG: VanZ family protein [Micrococcaceae bacterium]|nr:VanZ family protein [Micrococcaceae bacterium]